MRERMGGSVSIYDDLFRKTLCPDRTEESTEDKTSSRDPRDEHAITLRQANLIRHSSVNTLAYDGL